MVRAYELAGYQSHHKKIGEQRLLVRKVRAELMQKLVEMEPGRVTIDSGGYRNRENWLNLDNGPPVAVRVCLSFHLVKKGRMWRLQAAKRERCRVTLIAGMNAGNTGIEAFYVTGRLRNGSKLHIRESSGWLKEGVRLDDLRSFYEVAMSRQWEREGM